MHVDEIRESFWPWFAFFNTEKSVIYERSYSKSPSNWLSYFSLLVVSEEYTLENI